MRKIATLAATIAALVCVSSLRAHHSISMIDTSTPIWVKGTVAYYKIVNPHTMIGLEERMEDGQVKRWTVEGPILSRIQRMGVDENFLKNGDVIEICGFRPKAVASGRSAYERGGASVPFVHGHMLIMPDGAMSPWGPYGKLENCVRPDDPLQPWLDFLNTDSIARDLWCNSYRTTVPTIAASKALVDEINRRMGHPCE
jgi:hypothetical protein